MLEVNNGDDDGNARTISFVHDDGGARTISFVHDDGNALKVNDGEVVGMGIKCELFGAKAEFRCSEPGGESGFVSKCDIGIG